MGDQAAKILGVSGLYHDAAAALVEGGEIIAAAQEERFTRRKNDESFPRNAIRYCIGETSGKKGIDAVAFYEDPVLLLDRVIKNAVEMAPDSEVVWREATASQFGQKLDIAARLRDVVGPETTVFVVDHHLSHAASAFYPSPYRNAAIVVADGIGEWASTTIAAGQDTRINVLSQIGYPHSLGLFYSAFTHHCGLKVNSGEYKLMGLAPYGEPRYVNLILDNLIDLKPDGSFRLNTEYFGYLSSNTATNPAFEQLVGSPRRDPESMLTVHYMDLAASAQAVIDEAMLRIAHTAMMTAGSRHLCLAGGLR